MVRLRTSHVGVLLCIVFSFLQGILECSAQQTQPQSRQKSAHQHGSFIIHSSPTRSFTISTSANNINKRQSFMYKQWKPTTPKATIMRGDQQPPNDDDGHDDDPEFYPLGGTDYRYHFNTPTYQTVDRGAYRPPQRSHPCEQRSCYPATGNLLIGREDRLTASSTCGLNGPERFCIVSHLEEKKCFLCDTREETQNDTLKNHRIGQIIYKIQPGTRDHSWWQSENGKENVTIQLDLEAEFHFTHLIIVFATFRPAAMLIERSYDFGRSWHVYKHFAHNCQEAFPDVPRIAENITDVVCDQRYSAVEPSKNGEVIFRVLPPNMNIENPYAKHIQNMLKMTNLRINFTKLHNLGDTLLDDRREIQEKYYYAISNMVVRGSCSCSGHASRCLPLEGVLNKVDMVHGRCECTHNTKGLNCEECEDFFNDLPWQPALGKQTNACKKCNCNNHANSCHFDQVVYEQSGRVSGGVCDNCQHNTQGQHCEACIPFFYRDPQEDIQSPYVCRPCNCDPKGSLDEGICDSISDIESGIEAGLCHCKPNVRGRQCDVCKEGYWNLNENSAEGCELCMCNILGTRNNSGCNMHTGECSCKDLVTGKDCNQCLPETYGLSESYDGCTHCDCDPGGSLDNNCDVITGQCRCRPHMTGRTCRTPQQNYYVPSLHNIYEAEDPQITDCVSSSSYGNCTAVGKRPQDGPATGPGFTRVHEGTELQINIDGPPRTMQYDVVVRYQTQVRGDWEVARITIERPDGYDLEGACSNAHPSYEQNIPFALPEQTTSVKALSNVCLEQDKVYKVKLYFERHRQTEDNPAAQILIDSLVIIPRIEETPIFKGSPPADVRKKEFDHYRCNDTLYNINYEADALDRCLELLNTAGTYVSNGADPCNCDPTGSTSKKCLDYGGFCQCKANVVGRRCDKCAIGHYGFGPEGCKACDCNSIGATDNDCDLITGQCTCHPNTYGRECDQCQPGFWNFPNCQMCECNGHSQTCDSHTGECISCQEFTSGYNCDRCIEGFYGNPLLGSEIGCRPCRCPDTLASGHSHADQCQLDPRTNDMICYCREGYTGLRCDVCADNYFGHPEKMNGTCDKCECSNNVDLSRHGNCDLHTGKCLQCLYDTTGDSCEHCRDGFFGDALAQDCRQCDCDVLGTNGEITHCDRKTGQCPCLRNVEGIRCDQCAVNHWKIASGEGCEHCRCDKTGSENDQCNPYDGQCRCKAGFGGRQCDQCQANYWGDPNKECHHCDCDPYGSATAQCDRITGQCKCIKGIGGYKCDQCDRGYLGQAPYCSPCGECFDNWDLILNQLREDTMRTIEEAKQIKTTGATGAYTKEFDVMEKKLAAIRSLLSNATVSVQDIDDLDELVLDLKKNLNESLINFKETENSLEYLYSNVNLANVALDDLRDKGNQIQSLSSDLKRNATQLQEANVEGALNLTRQSWQKANLLTALDAETVALSADAERQCRRTEALLHRSTDEFNALQDANEDALDRYHDELQNLTRQIPDLNEQICDKRGDPCDNLCGGAGCNQCGGLSCEKGAVTRAEKALNYVKDTEKNIKQKEDLAEDLIRSLSQAKTNASEAYRRAESAYLQSDRYLNNTKELIDEGNELIANLTNVLNNNTASPSEIQKLAEETIALDLELDPEEIKVLADKIDSTVSQLENVESIIYNTRHDLERVERLKELANSSKQRADEVLESAKKVVQSLEEADAAQTKARNAIKLSNEDISLARADLEQIDGETGDAQNKADETARKVNQLGDKLSELQKKFLKNSLDANEIKNQSDQVRDSASNAHDSATQLRDKYRQANDSLTEKALASESARERAQQLFQRASKITVDTSSKLKELQGMADVYKSNDRELRSLQEKVDQLNGDISEHLTAIQKHSDRYRQCTS